MSRTFRHDPDSIAKPKHHWEPAVKAGVTKCAATGKRIFKSVAAAQARADEINLDPRDGINVFPYTTKCEFCKQWHLTKG